MNAYLTPKAQKELERTFALRSEIIGIFKLVVAEWKTDPTSVQCFDLRTVKRAVEIDAEMKKLDVFY